ncbi:MAG: cation:proton antiporter [Rikenellaceae bacterium]
MLTSLAYILILGILLGSLFRLLRLPSLIGMLLTGMILGGYGLDLLDQSIVNISVELRQIALVVILLRAGLALDIRALKRVGRSAVLISFVPACLEIGGIMLIAPWLLGVTLVEAAIMGAVVAAVSPAVIVPRMLNLMDRGYGTSKSIPQMIMAGGSVDDVFVIVLFTSFLTLATGGAISGVSFLQIPISIVLGLILGVIVGWALVLLFRALHMRDSVKLLIILSCSFLFLTLEKAVAEVVSISGLLAVMAMGATILQRYPLLARRISPKFNKLWVGAEILLFVLVGATVDLSYAWSSGLVAVLVIVGALFFRMAGTFISTMGAGLTFRERLFCMIAYIPKATVQAAIGSLPLAMGLECGNMVLTVAVLAIIITAPIGALGIDLSYKRLLSKE